MNVDVFTINHCSAIRWRKRKICQLVCMIAMIEEPIEIQDLADLIYEINESNIN